MARRPTPPPPPPPPPLRPRQGAPHEPTLYEDADVYAIQALARGKANESQQMRALRWILQATGLRDLSYRPNERGGELAMAFAEGKRFVGLQIEKLIEFRPPPEDTPKR